MVASPSDSMPDCQLIDLALHGHANRILDKLLRRQGIRWFLDPNGNRLMALDGAKVELIVRIALKARARADAELCRRSHPVTEDTLGRCRKHVRRELIARVAQAMVATGC